MYLVHLITKFDQEVYNQLIHRFDNKDSKYTFNSFWIEELKIMFSDRLITYNRTFIFILFIFYKLFYKSSCSWEMKIIYEREQKCNYRSIKIKYHEKNCLVELKHGKINLLFLND